MKNRDLFKLVALAAVALSGAINPSRTDAGPTIYISGSSNEFGTLDLASGNFTSVGTLALSPSGDLMFGMGFGADGKLYGLDSQAPNSHLWRINVTNAGVTDLGSVGQSAIGATSDASGKMYALSQDANGVFYTLNPPSATSTTVGLSGIYSSGFLAVNAASTQIFTGVIDGTTGKTDLYSINKTTGLATLIGDTGFNLDNGLYVNGTLYGFDYLNFAIVSINTITGAGTKVATYSLPKSDTILSSAFLITPRTVPEPSSAALVLIALIGGGAHRLFLSRRMRHRSAAIDG